MVELIKALNETPWWRMLIYLLAFFSTSYSIVDSVSTAIQNRRK